MIRPAAAALLVACAVGTACTAREPRPAETIRPGGEFVVAIPSTPRSLNPNGPLDEAALPVTRNLFNALIAFDEDARLVADLAESWSVSDDGRSYTFTIAPDALWHDGAAVTSEDVRWSLEAVKREGVARQALERVARIDAPDPRTVVIVLKHRWAPFAAELAGFGLSILPRHVFEGGAWLEHDGWRRPIGSGPFVFESRNPDGGVTLRRNPRYFRDGPFVDRVRFVVLDTRAAYEQLLDGRIDHMIMRPPQAELPGISRRGGVTVAMYPTPSRYYAALNVAHAPLDDRRVRHALAMATDRAALVDAALAGIGAPSLGWLTPAAEWAYAPDARVPAFDTAGARRLLREALGGRPLRLSIATATLSPFVEISRQLGEQWRRVGIDATVAELSLSEWTARVMERRDFDVAVLGGRQGPDPDALRVRFGSSGGMNFVGYANAAFDELVEAAARTESLEERAALYARAQHVLARDVPFLPLAESVRASVYRTWVRGLPQAEARGLVPSYDFSLIRVARPPAPGAN